MLNRGLTQQRSAGRVSPATRRPIDAGLAPFERRRSVLSASDGIAAPVAAPTGFLYDGELPTANRRTRAMASVATHRDRHLPRIIKAYDDPIVRAYCWVRFWILRQRFLDEIGQYLPASGKVLDVGCGFGLFSLYYAMTSPSRVLHGFDLNAKRIDKARRAASLLGLNNVAYAVGDVQDHRVAESFDCIYMLDIIHHVPPQSVEPLLRHLYRSLTPGGRLLIKDVDAFPRYKRLFTWALDRMLDPRAPVHYWQAKTLARLLRDVGFTVYQHLMVDYLPYPHVLYICRR